MILLPQARGVLAVHSVFTGVTWNPSDKSSDVGLSNANLTATGTTVAGDPTRGVRATTGASTGKKYWEVVYAGTFVSNFPYLGIKTSTGSLAFAGPFGDSTDYGTYRATSGRFDYAPGVNTVFAGPTTSIGDVVMLAVDLGAGKMWVGLNGTWDNSGNPAAGTGAAITGISAATYYAWAAVRTSVSVIAHFASSSFVYAAPGGFSPW